MDYQIIPMKLMGDERGKLVAIEGNKDIPFEIKRIFYIYGTQGNARRGCHANRKSEFVMIVVSGGCKVMLDDGIQKKVIELNHPNMGLYFDKLIWKEMFDFIDGTVLLVLSNEYYDENEYIRDYDSFLHISAKLS